MTDLTLENFKLTRNLTARTAMDVSLALTGHRRESDLARYLSLALHFASWTLAAEASLREHGTLLSHLSPESSTQLLDALSFPFTFSVRGDQDKLPSELVADAQAAAKTWRRTLLAKNCDVLRLHERSLGVLREALAGDVKSQRMLVAELQVLLMCNERDRARAANALVLCPQGRGTDTQGSHPVGGPRAKGKSHAEEAPLETVRTFSNPVEAMQFIMSQASLMGLVPPAAPKATPRHPGAHEARPPASTAEKCSGARMQVFNPQDAFAVLQKLPPPSPHEGNNQQRRVLENMAADAGWRPLRETPPDDPLVQMYLRFPHFKGPLDYIARSLAMAACGDSGRPVRISPLLLRGGPGTGKTYFAQELARALGTHFVERDLAVTSEAFVIAGMDPSWKGSKPGIIFEALVNGKTANPVVLLNEVDKAKVTGTLNSPLAPLYALLEPASAVRFVDEFVPVNLDTSGVIWILTANDGFIPDPILTRLEVFDIPQPNQEEARAIAVSVWESLCLKSLPRGHGFPRELPAELLNLVSALNPRVMRRVLVRAAGEAAFASRKHLVREDLDAANAGAQGAGGRSIGFLP